MNFINDTKNNLLLDEMKAFTDSVKTVFHGLYGKTPIKHEDYLSNSSLELNNDLTVSLFFVGTVFGEFIISMSNDTAKYLASNLSETGEMSQDDIRDSVCEALNMAAGSRLKFLTQRFQKLTITAPRSISGKVRYPSVRAMQTQIDYNGHFVTICFYLDEMKLDIAESYKFSIEQLKNANQELLFANEKLKLQQMQLIQSEKMASLGTMAAGVAHEINNPLSYVMSNTEILSSYITAFQELFSAYQGLISSIHDKNSKEAHSVLKRVKTIQEEKDISYILEDTINLMTESQSGLDRIRGIVNGLKLFSRVDDAGARNVQINDELKNTLQLIANELKYKCKVDFVPGELPEIECIPGELGQVFVNLLVNASQAMPEAGGKITVRTSGDDAGVKIAISDTGCGIPKENLQKIFDPFFTTKPVGQGTGLGLAITHSIVKKHGGDIAVESEVGKGTTFTISLPIVMEKNEEEKEPPSLN